MKKIICLALALLCMCSVANAVTYGDEGVFLSVGGSYIYARDNQGQIYVWGDNQFGQLGNGGTRQKYNILEFTTKNADIDLSQIVDVIPGSDYSFFLMQDGTLWGVGNNDYSPLADKGDRYYTHIRFNVGEPVVKVECGFGHVLALNAKGEVYAWGRNNAGQVGNGFRKNTGVAYNTGLTDIVQIVCGGKFSLALAADGTLWGWGDNEYNTINMTKDQVVTRPTKIEYGDIDIAYIDACGASVVLLDTDGVLWTWGRNDMHQLGYDTKGKSTKTPQKVDLPLPVVYVAAYSSQTYAILSDGSLWSWGNNSYGQLGQGFRSAASEGVLPGKAWDSDVVMVMGGSLCMSAMLADGTIISAGISKFGQQGDGTQDSHYKAFANGLNLIK